MMSFGSYFMQSCFSHGHNSWETEHFWVLQQSNSQPKMDNHLETRPFFFLLLHTFYNCIVPMGFLPWEVRVAFPGESQLRQSRATQPTVRAGCFSVSTIHRTLTRTKGSLMSAQMLMHAIAHGGVQTP